MEDGNDPASNVAQAIAAALDWNSTPEARKVAVSYLESVKTGDIRFLASTSLLLVKKNWSSEIRLHAFKMLQIVRRKGLNLWQELLPSLVSLSSKGPIQAELVSMMLRWLPEDITVHNEDLEGDRRRLLLRGLTQSLPKILPLLYSLLEKHFGAALSEVSRQQLDIAKHAATVIATLNTINAYAEWAPLPDLAKYGIIHGGCGFLLSSPDFRLHACEFFKLVSPRKRPADASASEFESAIRDVFLILMKVSGEFLYRSGTNAEVVGENKFEFAEYVCESMVSLGTSNLQCIAGDGTILSLYLQQMQGYFQHFKLSIHVQSLFLGWH